MAKAGDSTFGKVLKDSGGYIVECGDFKCILSVPPPTGITCIIQTNEAMIKFVCADGKVKGRLNILVYEPVGNNNYIVDRLKYIQFYGNVYMYLGRKLKKTIRDTDTQISYYCNHIILDEV